MQHDDQRDRCSNLVGFGSVDKIGTATSGAVVDKLLPGRVIRTRTVLKMCQESSNCQDDEQKEGKGPNSEMLSPVCQECWFQHAHSLILLPCTRCRSGYKEPTEQIFSLLSKNGGKPAF